MSVILEFSVASDAFQLGEVLAGPADMHLELERIVPTGDQVMPFVWATGQGHESFEERVNAHPAVEEFQAMDRVGDGVLYRITWAAPPTDLLEGIAETEAVILEARGNEYWEFDLRFPDHEHLAAFHDYLIDGRLPIEVERTYTLTEGDREGYPFGLTQAQRDALVLATKRGHFDVPRGATLEELGDELDVTRQALSERIRRASGKVFRATLLPTDDDID